ncbi:MAG: ABC transporter permease subunit [Bacillota bacterium]|nr:ABC transporter permease subunit [Bacillota bacterium]
MVNSRAIRAIAVKDMKAVFANIQVWLPMLILPLVLGVVLPAGLLLALRLYGAGSIHNLGSLLAVLDRVPPSELTRALGSLPSVSQRLAYLMVNYVFAPFFLLIPLMTSSVISADSFAGEKERGTLESLLLAPVDLTSLLLGKVLAAFLPSMGLSLVTFVLYGLATSVAGWPLFGRPFFPQPNWVPLMLLVIPTLSLGTILLNVFISARVSSFQAAYQLGGVIVLPVMALLFGQLAGALLLDTAVLVGMGAVLALLDFLVMQQILRRLDRSRLFESQVR